MPHMANLPWIDMYFLMIPLISMMVSTLFFSDKKKYKTNLFILSLKMTNKSYQNWKW